MQREREKEYKREQKEERRLERERERALKRERNRQLELERERRAQLESVRRAQLEREYEQKQQQSTLYRRLLTADDPIYGELTGDIYPDCMGEPRFYEKDELGFELSDMERFRPPSKHKLKSDVNLHFNIGPQESVTAIRRDMSYPQVNLAARTKLHSLPEDRITAISETTDSSFKSIPQASSSAMIPASVSEEACALTSTDNSNKPTQEQVSTCSESQTTYKSLASPARTNLRETISAESTKREKRSRKVHSSSHFFAPPKESMAQHSMSSAELTSLYIQRRMCNAIAAARHVEEPPDDPYMSVGPGYLPRPSTSATRPTLGFSAGQPLMGSVQPSKCAAHSTTSSDPSFKSAVGSSTNFIQPFTGATQLVTSSNQLYMTADRRSKSFTQPSTNAAENSSCHAQPSISYAQPSMSYAQPSMSYAQPSMSYAQAARHDAQPSTSYAQPATYAAQPATYAAQPATYAAQPSTSYAQPATSPRGPSTSTLRPPTSPPRPSTSSAGPSTSYAQPATCAAQPSTGSPRPSTRYAPFFTSGSPISTGPRSPSICSSAGDYPNERLHHNIKSREKFREIRKKIAMLTFHDIPPLNYDLPKSVRSPTFIAPKRRSILFNADEPNVDESNVEQQNVDKPNVKLQIVYDPNVKQQNVYQQDDNENKDDVQGDDQKTDDQKADDLETDDQQTDQQAESSSDHPKRKYKSVSGKSRRSYHTSENIVDVSLGRIEDILEMVLTLGFKISKGEKDTFGAQQVPTPIHNAMVDIRKFLEPMKHHLKDGGRSQYFRPYFETITDALNPLYHHLNDGQIALKSPATRNYVSLPFQKEQPKKHIDEPIQLLYSMETPQIGTPYANYNRPYGPSAPLRQLPPLHRPRVVPMGLIEMPFMRDLMVILTVDLGITVINREDNVIIALSADGTRSGFKFRYGEVYQRQNEVIDVNCLDPFQRVHKRARFCHRGITFKDEMSPMTYCITQGGTASCQRLISNANGRLLGESFYYGSRYGQVYVSDCAALLELSRHSYDEDGSITWIINNLRIRQMIDGELIIHKERGNYAIVMQPSMPDEDEHYAMTINSKLTTPLYQVTSSVASRDVGVKHHFYVRQQKKSVFCNNEKFVVRNISQTAGIDKDHNIRLHVS